MSLLTEQELEDCYNSPLRIADAIEAAVIKKLADGVKVEPFPAGYIAQTEYFVEFDQCMAAIAAARVQALREADQVAGPDDSYRDEWFNAKADSSKKIRALIGGQE